MTKRVTSNRKEMSILQPLHQSVDVAGAFIPAKDISIAGWAFLIAGYDTDLERGDWVKQFTTPLTIALFAPSSIRKAFFTPERIQVLQARADDNEHMDIKNTFVVLSATLKLADSSAFQKDKFTDERYIDLLESRLRHRFNTEELSPEGSLNHLLGLRILYPHRQFSISTARDLSSKLAAALTKSPYGPQEFYLLAVLRLIDPQEYNKWKDKAKSFDAQIHLATEKTNQSIFAAAVLSAEEARIDATGQVRLDYRQKETANPLPTLRRDRV